MHRARFFPALKGVLLWLCVICAGPLQAAGIIRDPDIEHGLNYLARPILLAAGLSPARIKVLVINDSRPNAFVTDGRFIFVHSGLILRLKSAAQLQSVLAHETAHIAHGHALRRLGNQARSSTIAGLGLALAVVAGAASGNGKAASGLAAGALGVAQRNFLAHTRAEEAAADQAGVRYLLSAGISPKAAVEVLDIFRGQEALSVGRQDPYTRTHPLTRDRLRAMQGFAAAHPQGKTDQTAQYWFARAQGKLSAFTRNPGWTLRRLKKGDTSDITLMRRAIALHRQPDAKGAIKAGRALAAARPKDPFVHELLGQILLESRQVDAAITAYSRAVALAPRNAQIQAALGRAQLAKGQTKSALKSLRAAYARDPRNPRMLRDLALAYAKSNQTGMAALTTAERYALQGRLKDAATHAKRASGLLNTGSAPWRRAQDILAVADRATKR